MALYSVFSNSRGAVLTLSLRSMSHCWQPRIIPRAQMKSVINQGLCLGRKKLQENIHVSSSNVCVNVCS